MINNSVNIYSSQPLALDKIKHLNFLLDDNKHYISVIRVASSNNLARLYEAVLDGLGQPLSGQPGYQQRPLDLCKSVMWSWRP